MKDAAAIQSVLDFWFAETGATAPTAADSKRWFSGGEALDQEIKDKFSPLLEQNLEEWLGEAHSCLAFIILHDQFPLNIYRRQARAYAWEERAEKAALVALDRDFDQGLGYGERVFMYMPLMHAEKLPLQELAVSKFAALADEVAPALQQRAQGTLKFAREHRDTVATFSRFPFRNAVLGRYSTEQELAFLSGDTPRYGQ